MKKIQIIITLVLSLGLVQFSFAQEIDPALMRKMALETCECFPSDVNTAEETMNSDESRDCVAKKAFEYRKILGVHTELGDDEFSPDISMDIFDKVTLDLLPLWAKSCPAFFNYMLYNMEKSANEPDSFLDGMPDTAYFAAEDTNYESYEEEYAEEEEKVIKGKIKEIKTDQYTFVVITDSEGQKHELLWMYYSDILENVKKNKKKEVNIYWYEDDLYNFKQKDYTNYKVINWLEIIE